MAGNTEISAQWSTPTRGIVIVVTLVLAGLFLYAVRPLLTPLVIAGLIAYTLNPVVQVSQRQLGWNRDRSVNAVYIAFLLLVIVTPGTLAPVLVRQIAGLSGEFQIVVAELQAMLSRPIVLLGWTFGPEHWEPLLESTLEAVRPATDTLSLLEATSTSLLWLIFVVVTTFFLLRDGPAVGRWLVQLAPEASQADLARLLAEIDDGWRAYLRGTLVLMFIMGVVFIIAGLAIGLPGAVGLGLVTGLLSMIPELGPTIAGILSVLVAFFLGSMFLPLSNFWFAVLVAGFYLVVMQIKSLWLRPLVMGRFMHMNTGLVFVAIIGAAILQGVLAALLILPVIATVASISRYARCRLLGLDPWPEVVKSATTGDPQPGPRPQPTQG